MAALARVDDHRVASLDGLRFFAAVIVFVSHFSNQTKMLDGRFGQGGGQLGVMIFFMLSGYLMASIYLPEVPSPQNVLNFFVRRTARIVPLYLIIVVVSFVVTERWRAPSWLYAVDNNNIWQHLAFIRGVSVLWTIPVEVQFYLIAPVIWWLYAIHRKIVIIVLVSIVVIWFCFGVSGYVKADNMIGCVHYFVGGFLIFFLWRNSLVERVTPAIWNVVFVASMISVIVLFPKVRELFTGSRVVIWSDPATFVAVGCLVLSTVHASLATMLLGNVVMRFLGTISYGVYLIHQPILDKLDSIPIFWHFAVGLMATIFCATFSYLLLERPIIQAARNLTARPSLAI